MNEAEGLDNREGETVQDLRGGGNTQRQGGGSRRSSTNLGRLSVKLDQSAGLGVHSRRLSTRLGLTQQNTVTPAEATGRLRHAMRLLAIILRWITTKEDEITEDSSNKTFTDLASDAFISNNTLSSGLSFDLSSYKAVREVNISSEVKQILGVLPEDRTPDQIQTTLYGLQHLRSFAEYPLHMQEKLCRVARYQSVPAKKVIIRQGHFAENFYFILSGQVVVRKLDRGPGGTGEPQMRTVGVLRKGYSFGELALLYHSLRTATVVSGQEMVQLLVIGRQDFFHIFMGEQAADGVPHHIQFISTLDFMKGWPLHLLIQHPEHCLFHFFKRGTVIVNKSTECEWIYIVKSGSCSVMKELNALKPLKKDYFDKVTPSTAHKSLFEETAPVIAARTDSRLKQRPRVRPPSPVKRSKTMFYEILPSKKKTRTRSKSSQVVLEKLEPKVSSHKLPPVDHPGAIFEPGFSESSFLKCPSISTKAYFMSSPHASAKMSLLPAIPQLKRDNTELFCENKSVFVKMQLLKPKDTFGLASLTTLEEDDNIDRSKEKPISLVSNGAECIMLSKRFYLDHATESVQNHLRQIVRPYPNDTTLHHNYFTKSTWDLYKKRTLYELCK